jgi:hypothetical protein
MLLATRLLGAVLRQRAEGAEGARDVVGRAGGQRAVITPPTVATYTLLDCTGAVLTGGALDAELTYSWPRESELVYSASGAPGMAPPEKVGQHLGGCVRRRMRARLETPETAGRPAAAARRPAAAEQQRLRAAGDSRCLLEGPCGGGGVVDGGVQLRVQLRRLQQAHLGRGRGVEQHSSNCAEVAGQGLGLPAPRRQ